jgi:hypothetical protein
MTRLVQSAFTSSLYQKNWIGLIPNADASSSHVVSVAGAHCMQVDGGVVTAMHNISGPAGRVPTPVV